MAETLKRARPGWLARSMEAVKALTPDQRAWIERVKANWTKDQDKQEGGGNG